MSVRRLAEDTVQPAVFAFSTENETWAERTIGRYPAGRQQSAVIPLLMRAQEQDGWVTKAAIEHVADRLAMPLIRVLEVATFYTQFQLKPVGTRAHVQVCGTTPCMLRGSDELKDVCRQRIHHDQFHLNKAGTLSWEEVECLGACVNAPMVMIFKDTFEDLTPERLEEIIDAFERGEGASVRVGPQIDRHLSAPFGGPTTLLSDDGDRSNGGADGSGPVENGAPPQGPGPGTGSSVPPSQAARPDTHAPETDASMLAAGKAQSADNSPQGAEAGNKVDVAAGADQPGAGQTGGTRQGPTGAAKKDADALDRGSASKDADVARRDGLLGEKGHAAEEAVVKQHRIVDGIDNASEHGVSASKEHQASGNSSTGRTGSEIDLGEAGPKGPTRADLGIAPPVEAHRATDDATRGPTPDDAARAQTFAGERRERVPASDAAREQGVTQSGRSVPGDPGYTPIDEASDDTAETDVPAAERRKPAALLDGPDGQPDDLKAIRGIEPAIERALNDLGVFHFRQIAAWSPQELAWVDHHINLRGQALRETWVEQAREREAARLGRTSE